MNTLNDYMDMSYRMEIIEDKNEGGFVVNFSDLPGCITCGETIESALANALDAKKLVLKQLHTIMMLQNDEHLSPCFLYRKLLTSNGKFIIIKLY